MREYSVADLSMICDLKDMLKVNFQTTDEDVQALFNRILKVENCVVCIENGKVVSQLHMVPVKIRNGESFIPCHYIYAASTLEDYRNRGCMTGLLEYACKVARERGQKYSILVPSSQTLFKFYEKCGYQRFYKYKRIELTAEEMRKFIVSRNNIKYMDLDKVQRLRSEFYSTDGELIWDRDFVENVFLMNEVFKGENVFVDGGYAIISCLNFNAVEVTELAYGKENIENLLGDIYNTHRDKDKYVFRVPVREEFFGRQGAIIDQAVIRSLDSAENMRSISFINEKSKIYPFFGFDFG